MAETYRVRGVNWHAGGWVPYAPREAPIWEAGCWIISVTIPNGSINLRGRTLAAAREDMDSPMHAEWLGVKGKRGVTRALRAFFRP